MKTLRVLIVEDEANIRTALREGLRIYNDVAVVAEAATGEEGRAAFEEHRPDVVFLDIVMETTDAGLRLAKRLNQQPNPPHIVFVTAYPELSGQAIKHHPADFLTKPWHEDDLAQALQWIRQNPKKKEERILLSGMVNGRKMIGAKLPEEIVYFKANGNAVSAHLADGQVVSDIQYTLQEWETELQPLGFLLIHRRYLVNRHHAKWMARRDNSAGHDLLAGPGDDKLEIARDRIEDVRQWLAGHVPRTSTIDKLAEKLAISQQEYFDLEKKYFTDPLTGVGSRPAFTQQINAAISKAQRSSSPLSLLMVDADHFKKTNDRYGHDAGDKTLQKLAGLFGELTREVDFVARWGGEEFMVVLPDTGLDAALALAERIRAGIGQAGDWPCEPVTVSIGAAQWQPGQDAAALINQADEALFRAKEGGRNRVSQ